MPKPDTLQKQFAEISDKFVAAHEDGENATVLEALTIEINKYAVDALTLLEVDYSPQAVTALLVTAAARGPKMGGAVRWREYQTDEEGAPASLERLRESVAELERDNPPDEDDLVAAAIRSIDEED